MTHFFTETGVSLGARFAGDAGAVFHLTEQERLNLFNLSNGVLVVDECAGALMLAEELVELFTKGVKADAEQMKRRWGLKLEQSLNS